MPTARRKLRLDPPARRTRSPVRQILPSGRNKSLLSLDDDGDAASGPHDQRAPACFRSRRSRAVRCGSVALGRGATPCWDWMPPAGSRVWRIDAGCPEISFKTLFGKVLYEGYDAPEYVWQTTGGEDFEPKFSLVPLLFGTLKGTFYAMLFAVPLALFGAAYASYFTTPAFAADDQAGGGDHGLGALGGDRVSDRAVAGPDHRTLDLGVLRSAW